jgi:RNA polymerase sigma factor (sigma-70 family)
MRTEDGYIIYKCLNGDKEAFGFLVDKYKAAVHALAYSRLRNFHDAQDMSQEAFIRAYENLHKLKRWDSFASWLFRITWSLCMKWMRSKARRPDGEFVEDQGTEVHDNQSVDSYRDNLVLDSIHESLESLPEVHRQVLVMHYMGGMTSYEIARFMGVSPAAVRKRLGKARSLLKAELISMMEDVFEPQKPGADFTLSVMELVKDIKVQPSSRIPELSQGLSISVCIMIVIMTSGAFMKLRKSHEIRVNSAELGATGSTGAGKIPVSLVEQTTSEQEGDISMLNRKKISIFTVVTAILGVLSGNVLAQTDWEKYPANPVLPLGAPGSWDDYQVYSPSIINDGSEYKMYYSAYRKGGHAKIGLATSPDGITWTKYAGNPVLNLGSSGSWDDYHINLCHVMFENADPDAPYKMWYVGYDGSHCRIGYATSLNGIAWTKYPSNPVLNIGPAGAFDHDDIHSPTVIRNNGEYWMWYDGQDVPNGTRRIGLATSTDGVAWTKHPANPVLDIGPEPWDANSVYFPNVIKSSQTKYEMWYSGNGTYSAIGYATSSDGIFWTKHPDNPVLDKGPDIWEDRAVGAPEVLKENMLYRMWYDSYTNSAPGETKIGYAESCLLDPCCFNTLSTDTIVASNLYQFRDNLLAKSKFGRDIINLYYQNSPEVAKILTNNPVLAVRSAAILKEVMLGIRSLIGDRKGVDIAMTPALYSRIDRLFEDIGKEGSEEMAHTLSMLSNWLNEYKGMRFSRIWRIVNGDEPKFGLMQNHPNPFNPETWIPYALGEDTYVVIRIYSSAGHLVRILNLGRKPAGFYTDKAKAAYWDGANQMGETVASGVYFYTMQAGEYTATRKMLIVK